MITVGNIRAEVLLKIEGMEGTYSVGHIEIPLSVTTDENRPMHLNLRGDTSGSARSVKEAAESIAVQIDTTQPVGTLRRNMTRYNKEN